MEGHYASSSVPACRAEGYEAGGAGTVIRSIWRYLLTHTDTQTNARSLSLSPRFLSLSLWFVTGASVEIATLRERVFVKEP